MEREITDPIGYRYILAIAENRLHIRRDGKLASIALTERQAVGLKAYLDKALRSKPSVLVEDYDGLILTQDKKTAAIHARQGMAMVEIYPPSWNSLASEIGLMIPYIEQTQILRTQIHPDSLN